MKAFSRAFLALFLAAFAASATAAPGGLTVYHQYELSNLAFIMIAASGQPGAGPADPGAMEFDAMGRRFTMLLESNERILSASARAALADDVRIFRGRVDGMPGSWVRLVVADGMPRGIFWDGGELYAIEAPGDSSVNSESPVVYRLADTYVKAGTMSCGMQQSAANGGEAFAKLMGDIGGTVLRAVGASTQLDLGMIGDTMFVDNMGAGAEAAIATRINNVDGIYSEQLGVQLAIQVVELFDSQSDPFSATTDSSDLLDEIGVYRQGSILQNANGLTHLYTGRDLDGTTVGAAYRGALCSTRFGAGLSEGNRGAMIDSLIAAHEIGHNFGAPHDGEQGSACEAQAGDWLMSTAIHGSDEFSPCSIAEMQPVIAAANCFVALPGRK
jgi:hypothetical protein